LALLSVPCPSSSRLGGLRLGWAAGGRVRAVLFPSDPVGLTSLRLHRPGFAWVFLNEEVGPRIHSPRKWKGCEMGGPTATATLTGNSLHRLDDRSSACRQPPWPDTSSLINSVTPPPSPPRRTTRLDAGWEPYRQLPVPPQRGSIPWGSVLVPTPTTTRSAKFSVPGPHRLGKSDSAIDLPGMTAPRHPFVKGGCRGDRVPVRATS
jgi:hypothetical protein